MRNGVQTVDRALQLLQSFESPEQELGVTELAGALGVHKSTASRLAATLAARGFLERPRGSESFRLGPELGRLGLLALAGRDLVELAGPALDRLADETGETINVAIAGPGGVEHLAQVDSRHYLGTSHWVGRRVPYHCTANGKVLLAFSAAGADAGELDARTSRTIVERAQLAAELQNVRRAGFATAVDELELGLSAVAAPVLDDSGRAVAALSVSGPTLRLSPRRVAELRPLVIKQARALAELLGLRTEGVHAA